MVNTNLRELMLFEFNRALSYISEIIEIERKEWKLEDLKRNLFYEIKDWKEEEDLAEEEKVAVKGIIADAEKREQDIRIEIKELEEYKETLKTLVSKIIEAITKDKKLLLERTEIRQDMLEEYVYLVCNIKTKEGYVQIDDVFDEVAYFVVLLVEMYGEDVTYLVDSILNESIGYFGDYFK